MERDMVNVFKKNLMDRVSIADMLWMTKNREYYLNNGTITQHILANIVLITNKAQGLKNFLMV